MTGNTAIARSAADTDVHDLVDRTSSVAGVSDSRSTPIRSVGLGSSTDDHEERLALLGPIRDLRSVVLLRWAQAIREIGGPQYVTSSMADLEASLDGLFRGFETLVAQNDSGPLASALFRVATHRLEQGVPFLDIQRAIGCLRIALLPETIRAFHSKPELLSRAIEALMMAQEIAAVQYARAYQERTRAEIESALYKTLAAEEEKVKFCRDMARALTGDRLILCDRTEIPAHSSAPSRPIQVASDVRSIRRFAAQVSVDMGWSDDRSYDLQLCVGEAGTNVIRHAGSGTFQVWRDRETIVFRISDGGPGIEFGRLPQALSAGHSTRQSLGIGFTIMLDVASKLRLATDARGTVLELTLTKNSDMPVG